MIIKHSILSRRAKTISLLLSTATLFSASPALWADSPSQMMEAGVYSEETKGDLDNAVQLFQKVIAAAKVDQTLAAQAQYHLGLCYYKKKDFTDANAAFAALIKDYPDQKDLVALAQKYLAGVSVLQPAPWVNDEDLRLELKLAGGMNVGVMDFTVHGSETTNGQKICQIGSHTTALGAQSVSRVEVDATTFAPIHSWWKHSLLGVADATYYPDHVNIVNGKGETNTIDFSSPVIDNEETLEWIRRLPLADGYKIDQPLMATLVSHMVPVSLTVSGPESVTVPAGTYSCYKVAMNIGQTFWYSADANRYLVRLEAGGAVGELSSVTQRAPGEPVTYQNTNFGFSLTAPGGWFLYAQPRAKTNIQTAIIIDPQGSTVSSLAVRNFDVLEPEETNSIRAFAESKLASAAKEYKDFVVRPKSWTVMTVGGQPAVGVIADLQEGDTKKIAYGVFSFGAGKAVEFSMMTSATDFDTFRPTMDAIINSYTSK